jgi:hypothetical protein
LSDRFLFGIVSGAKQRLQDKSAQLDNDAEDFLALAKKLNKTGDKAGGWGFW